MMLAFLGSKLIGFIAAALVGAAVVGYVQQLRVDAVKGSLKAEQTINTGLRADNAACAANVAQSNAAVQALKDASDARAQAATEALAAANAKAKQQETQIATLAKRPPSSTNSCVAIKDLRHEYMRLRK